MANSLNSSIPSLKLPKPLKIFLLLSVLLTTFCFVYTMICRYMGMGLPYTFPYFYTPTSMFRDINIDAPKIAAYGTAKFFSKETGYFMYPAPLVHIYRFLLAGHFRWHYFEMAVVFLLILCIIFLKSLRKSGMDAAYATLFVCATAILSYPFSIAVQRGNIELIVWFFTSLGIWQFYSGNSKTAGAILGVAASLKLYPIILFGLFLPRRLYKAFFVGIAVFLSVTIFSLWLIGPTVKLAYLWNAEQMQMFSRYYAGRYWAIGYDHSFFGLIKILTLPWHLNLDAGVRLYTIIAACVSLVLYFTRIWRVPIVNQIIVLSVLNVMLAPVSFDYTLLNLYPAFGILVISVLTTSGEGSSEIPLARTYFVLFALIFTPESYLIFHGIRYAAQFRALCLIAILLMALMVPIQKRSELSILRTEALNG